MKSIHLRSLFLAPLAAACLLAATLRAEDAAPTIIKFSDPAKPGTLKIHLGRGDLHLSGTDTGEVSVRSSARATAPKRKDGLRVLTSSSSFAIVEKDNTITLDATDNAGRSSGDYTVVVPRNTSVIIQDVWSGDIVATGIHGDIEATTMNGDMKFDDVSGGLIASTTNGDITVSIRELRDSKPLSFTSISGEVELHVPASTKANVRFRTQNGAVATDFDDKVLVTKTENSPTTTARFRGRTVTTGGGATYISADAQHAIQSATRAAVESAQEIAAAVKAGLEEAQLSRDQARTDRDRAYARGSAEHSASQSSSQTADGLDVAGPRPPRPPVPPVPTITGGKLVTGTLNGGGTEISVSTMNGDIVFRQK